VNCRPHWYIFLVSESIKASKLGLNMQVFGLPVQHKLISAGYNAHIPIYIPRIIEIGPFNLKL